MYSYFAVGASHKHKIASECKQTLLQNTNSSDPFLMKLNKNLVLLELISQETIEFKKKWIVVFATIYFTIYIY